jgi:hypothetical protein
MKYLLLFSFVSLLFAYEQPQQIQKTKRFDEDLFRKNEKVISSHISFLYWSLEQQDLDYALKMNHPAWGGTAAQGSGKLLEAETGYQPGFRISLGFFNAPKLWEAKGEYTFFMQNKSSFETAPQDPNLFLVSTWPVFLPNPITNIRSVLQFHYHIYDLLVDRFFHPNEHLRMRLVAGLTGSYISQKWQVFYSDNTSMTRLINKWRFNGGGMKTGLHADWFWTSDIYLSGGMFISSLLGGYRNRIALQTTANPSGINNPDIPFQNISKNDFRLIANMQFLLGFSWQKSFQNCRSEVFAGYELNPWWNLEEIYRTSSGGPSESKQLFINAAMTTIHGLTTRLTVDF